MPPGSKKRKANRKTSKDETNPANPNSQALPPLPLHQHQGNGHASATDEDGEEEEEEEVFETPRSQPPDPVDAPHSGYGSSPGVPLDEVPVGAADENPVRAEGIVAGEEEPARAVGVVDEPVKEGVGITEADTGNVLYEEDSAAESPEVLIGKVDASVPHEKEVKMVPLQEEETSPGDGYLDSEADRPEATRAEGLDGMAMEKSSTDSTEVDTFNVEEAKEVSRMDDGSKQTNSVPIEIPVSEESLVGGGVAENHEILVDEVDSTSPPQESGEPSTNNARTESSQRSEVARGRLVVRRATLWNCCGLLDVFTGSQT